LVNARILKRPKDAICIKTGALGSTDCGSCSHDDCGGDDQCDFSDHDCSPLRRSEWEHRAPVVRGREIRPALTLIYWESFEWTVDQERMFSARRENLKKADRLTAAAKALAPDEVAHIAGVQQKDNKRTGRIKLRPILI
jgi:hypothetical protein